jgi:hypothetical protein
MESTLRIVKIEAAESSEIPKRMLIFATTEES